MNPGGSTITTPTTIGFLTIRAEAAERRAFLPNFVGALARTGVQVVLEEGYGAGIGLRETDYRTHAPSALFRPRSEVYQQDYIILIRYPGDAELAQEKPPGCLLTMAHFATRPQRVAFLRSLGLQVISFDSIKDDNGRRLVENLRAVAWNGVEAAFRTLRIIYPTPGFESPHRSPIRVLLLGAGAVGSHVLQAAIRYGDLSLWQELIHRQAPGVQVTTVDHDTTRIESLLSDLLRQADMVIDATQRPDPSRPVIPNRLLADTPQHTVLLDLSVDPYDCNTPPRSVKGLEGIPQGNLDQYVFAPNDPAYDLIPPCIDSTHRRYSVSCYSWPGVYPRACMEVYGHQLLPLLRTLIEKGGPHNLQPRGRYFERALWRAQLSNWLEEPKT